MALFEHFEKIFADFGLLSNYKIEMTPKTMMKIVYNTQETILKQIFPWNFSPFWPYDVILTPKTALFDHFEQVLADFSLLLNYNMVITAYNHGGDCS